MKLFAAFAILALVAVGVYALTMRAPATNTIDESNVKAVVEEFGTRLKNVALLAPQAELAETMQREYGHLVTPVLITTWLADPKNAPGRVTSSPWPDRIEIRAMRDLGEAYRIEGDIIEVTNEGGGIGVTPTETMRRPIALEVEGTSAGLRIRAVTLGAYPGDGEWTLSVPNAQGIRFMYPRLLPTTYVSGVEWPPIIERTANTYSCSEGPITAADGPLKETVRRMVEDREYCITTMDEGAAGSLYRTYEYAFEFGGVAHRAMFTLRFPQCENYDEPQRSLCSNEQQTFDIDGLMDRIAQSIR